MVQRSSRGRSFRLTQKSCKVLHSNFISFFAVFTAALGLQETGRDGVWKRGLGLFGLFDEDSLPVRRLKKVHVHFSCVPRASSSSEAAGVAPVIVQVSNGTRSL
jgi:hypothetical protein